jgi:hypothetical protein
LGQGCAQQHDTHLAARLFRLVVVDRFVLLGHRLIFLTYKKFINYKQNNGSLSYITGSNNSFFVFKPGPHFQHQEAQVGRHDSALLDEQCGLNFILFELNLLCPCPYIAQ